jgi:predicted metalloprotease
VKVKSPIRSASSDSGHGGRVAAVVVVLVVEVVVVAIAVVVVVGAAVVVAGAESLEHAAMTRAPAHSRAVRRGMAYDATWRWTRSVLPGHNDL